MRGIAGLLLAGCCVVSTGAAAAGVATVHTGDRTLTVSFQGGDARVDVSGVQRGYLVLRGDKVYSVMQVNGQPLVLDAQSAAGMLGGGPLHTSPDMIRSLTHIAATGAHESVAGRAGDVYTVTYVDAQGRTRKGRGVLGPQPEVRELTQVLAHMAVLLQRAGQQPAQGTEQVLAALKQRGMGLLAYGTQFRVEKISTVAPAPGTLDLPANPGQLPGNLGQLLQGLSPQPK
jgi:hypothetical protein